MSNFYRPSYAHDDLPPPPPPPEMPPLPRGPHPTSSMYRFGGDSWRPRDDAADLHRQDRFSFRSVETAPRYPPGSDRQNISSGDRKRQFSPNEQGDKDDVTGMRRTRRNGNQSNRGRGGRQVFATADRPLLRFERGITPDQMLGMNEDTIVEKRFLNADDLSDSNEESMDESDSNEYEPRLEDSVVIIEANGTTDGDQVINDGKYPSSGQGLPLKAVKQVGEPNTPRWSNPEYYTALPPPDESQRKKKDVVKLIRKARISVQKNGGDQSQVVANDDFISLNFGDDQSQTDDDRDVNTDSRNHGRGVPGAPLGPRAFSHLQTLHAQNPNHPPGTNGTYPSAQPSGPPPSSSVMSAQLPPGQINAVDTDGQRKRKRAVDNSASDLPRPPKRKKGVGGMSKGYVLEEWIANGVENPIPWILQPHMLTENPGFRLHKEICDFYDFVKPQEFEQVVREELLDRLQKAMKDYDETCEVRCFGSFAAGLYLPTADMDLVVVSRQFLRTGVQTLFQTSTQMHRLGRYLRKAGIAEHDSVEVISKAKVPIVKFVDRITSLKVDMSFENDTGLIANVTFDNWKQTFPALPIIVTVVKQFLMMRGLNEVANGGLGGFSVTCLVTSLLQNMPKIQTGELKAEQHLGEILLEFLDLYGNQLDISRTGITMEPPGYFDKRRALNYNPRKADRLAIIDPNKLENDISGGSGNIMLIFSRFSRARDEILRAMTTSNRPSLLDWMLGGNYNTFLWQRQRLQRLYNTRHGSLEPEYPARDTPEKLRVSLSKTHKKVQIDFAKKPSLANGLGFHHNEALEGLPIQKDLASSLPHSISLSKELEAPTKPKLLERPKQLDKGKEPKKLKWSMHDSASPLPSISRHEVEDARRNLQTAVEERANLLSYNGTRRKIEFQGPGEGQDLGKVASSMLQAEKKAAKLVDECRSILFKLEHPEIAATLHVPRFISTNTRKNMVRTWEAMHSNPPPPIGSLSRRSIGTEIEGNEVQNIPVDTKHTSGKDILQKGEGDSYSSDVIILTANKLRGTNEDPIIID